MGRKRPTKDIGIIKVDINEDMKYRADNLYDFDVLRGSVTKGALNHIGAMGEIVVAEYFKDIIDSAVSTYDYDFIINGKKVDVKSKVANTEPKENYNCSLLTWNTRQDCDYYLFVRVMKDLSCAYILGYISKEEFFDKAVYRKEGEKDTETYNFIGDSYHVPISALKKFKDSNIFSKSL